MTWAKRCERLSLTPGSVYWEGLRFAETDVRGDRRCETPQVRELAGGSARTGAPHLREEPAPQSPVSPEPARRGARPPVPCVLRCRQTVNSTEWEPIAESRRSRRERALACGSPQ